MKFCAVVVGDSQCSPNGSGLQVDHRSYVVGAHATKVGGLARCVTAGVIDMHVRAMR
jgi:hypothetical protein